MAINSCGNRIEVWKFKETGVVALCEEVLDFVNSGQADFYGIDPADGVLQTTADTVMVVFPRTKS